MPRVGAAVVAKKAVERGKTKSMAAMGPSLSQSRSALGAMKPATSSDANIHNIRTSYLVAKKEDAVQSPEDTLPINHPRFLAFIYSAILVNALQMGLQVDINGGAWDVFWKILDHVFTLIFAGEMALKLYYLRKNYFFDKWNVMDFFIAWSSILDSWLIPLATGGGGGAVLRMFQFLRLLRMVKVLRMRRDLLALVEGIIASMRSMFWVSLLLLLVIYTASILCVDIVGNDSNAEEYADQDMDNVFAFGTLRRAMLTLFSISILDNWSSIVTPISEVQPYMLPFFLMFLVTTSFGLMNALIGIIVEQTTAATARMEELDNEEKRQQQLGRVQELIDVVSKIDESNDGQISIEEMEAAKDNEDLNRILRSIDLPPGFSVSDLHLMLDENGNGTMSQEEFVEGMYQLIFCNEFQSQCVAKLSVAQIKKCVFELRRDFFEEMKMMRQQVFAMQKVILGDDAFGPEHAGSSQGASNFFADKPEIAPIKEVPLNGFSPKTPDQSFVLQEPKMKAERSLKPGNKARHPSKLPADSKPGTSIEASISMDNAPSLRFEVAPSLRIDNVGPDQEAADGGEKRTRKRRNSKGQLKKKGDTEGDCRIIGSSTNDVDGKADTDDQKSPRKNEAQTDQTGPSSPS